MNMLAQKLWETFFLNFRQRDFLISLNEVDLDKGIIIGTG